MPYIDRDIIERLIMKSGLYCDTDADKRYSVERIRSLPTADVVPVVRCRDCKYADQATEWTHCNRVTWWNGADDFCSRGERRADAVH